MIHLYLEKENEYWSKLGIDILLGAPLERKPAKLQSMFLPDYLFSAMAGAKKGNRRLVDVPTIILSFKENIILLSWIQRPFGVFSLILVLVLIASFTRNNYLKKALLIFDFLFFFTLGLAGI
ncbi:MAG: hypothetical protein NVS1B13_04850 [Flavisolibacter sp.]